MERLSQILIGTMIQLYTSKKRGGLKLGSMSDKPMAVFKGELKVGEEGRGQKEVQGQKEALMEVEMEWQSQQTSIGTVIQLYIAKEQMSHEPMAVTKGEVKVQMDWAKVEMKALLEVKIKREAALHQKISITSSVTTAKYVYCSFRQNIASTS